MKNQFLRTVLALVILTCSFYKAGAQNIQAEAKLQQYTIRIGDQTKLFISVHQPANAHVNFPRLTDTITGKVIIVKANKPDTAYDQDNRSDVTVTQSYLITSFDAGTYTLPAFSIGSEGGVLKTNELTLQVETVKVDTTKAIYDIKQPMAVSYTFWDWLHDNWYWIAIPLVVLIGIIGLILYLRKRPKTEPVIQVAKPKVPPHIVALNKLNELRDKKLWQQGQVKQYYIELSDIIREYVEHRYETKTHEKTTDEIFTSLKYTDIAGVNKELLRQILVLADLVKFAKEKPLPADNEQSMDNAVAFVNNTQRVQLSENREGGNTHV
ncbi:BatD family protein [Mucilaginibacter ginsenosidivorans]|uniref:Protein BatD n=1 Tax=Mucilaginibacter ginsenosidivorans TaxID=398053 RepID=A0A5B8UXZ3_9SPHI|nr:BatD family protein [Mucilaginibacter ginsenosidivorans]QEC63565.1 protein BatD [Mucilaginibacter ginsenosidivorans]